VSDPSISLEPGITPEELRLAARNHGMPLEALRYDVTPAGMHYLLIHFDVPDAPPGEWTVAIHGHVKNPVTLSLRDLAARETVTRRIVMECAGNGRARLSPRPISQPWLFEAVGNAEWTGTPLGPILEEAGLDGDVMDLVFTGADHGFQGEVEQDYQRSLSVEEAMGGDVLLAYEMNGQPLPASHGFPLRLIVPEWYGMASVKWLRSITAIADPFEGVQQTQLYRYRSSEDDPGTPVTRKKPRALMAPPGIPEFLSRARHVRAGRTPIEGRAWSGNGAVTRVEFSADGGQTWADARLSDAIGKHAWSAWSYDWDADEPGDYVLCVRATDAAGNVQPLDSAETWNQGGYGVNAVQRLAVRVV
jgi:sulfane dehydrogenase subunit SoxC